MQSPNLFQWFQGIPISIPSWLYDHSIPIVCPLYMYVYSMCISKKQSQLRLYIYSYIYIIYIQWILRLYIYIYTQLIYQQFIHNPLQIPYVLVKACESYQRLRCGNDCPGLGEEFLRRCVGLGC